MLDNVLLQTLQSVVELLLVRAPGVGAQHLVAGVVAQSVGQVLFNEPNAGKRQLCCHSLGRNEPVSVPEISCVPFRDGALVHQVRRACCRTSANERGCGAARVAVARRARVLRVARVARVASRVAGTDWYGS